MRNSIVCSVRKSSGHGHRDNERVPFRKRKRPAFFCYFFQKVETVQEANGQMCVTLIGHGCLCIFSSVISCCSINSINEPVVEFLQQSAGTKPGDGFFVSSRTEGRVFVSDDVVPDTCVNGRLRVSIDSTSHTAVHCADSLLSPFCRITNRDVSPQSASQLARCCLIKGVAMWAASCRHRHSPKNGRNKLKVTRAGRNFSLFKARFPTDLLSTTERKFPLFSINKRTRDQSSFSLSSTQRPLAAT
jgi:hypothetical protein